MEQMTADELNTATLCLVNQISECNTTMQISCNDGSVGINCQSLYIWFNGKFGDMVKAHIERWKYTELVQKLQVIAAHIDNYSKHHGGFTITTEA